MQSFLSFLPSPAHRRRQSEAGGAQRPRGEGGAAAPARRTPDQDHGKRRPVGSNHFRHVLKRLNRREFPNLLLEIQTNGQLLDRRAWSDLELEGLVESVWVSIDAARPATYEHLRRGGSFDRLMRNLAFVAGLRRERRIRSFQLDAVVQAANLDELPEIVDLGLRLGADRVSFQRIRNWGTFTAADFADHDVSPSRHPRFPDLCAVLRDPSLAGPYVDLGNLASH